MYGEDLYMKLNYVGMQKDVRKLAISDHPDRINEIAIMSTQEVCDLIAEDYEIAYAESEDIGLVRIKDIGKFNSLVKVLSR